MRPDGSAHSPSWPNFDGPAVRQGSRFLKPLGFSKNSKWRNGITFWEINSSPLKMDGWKMIFVAFGAYFQGRKCLVLGRFFGMCN